MENETTGVGTASATVMSSIAGWASHPFSTQMDIKGWALFVGLIIVLTVLWFFVLKDLRGEV